MEVLMKKSILPLLFLSLLANAHAGLLVEPVLGWTFGQKLDISGVDDYSGGQGLSYGGRLGYQRGPFQIGADVLKSSVEMDSNDFKENVDITEMGAFIGFELPILLRAYAGYIASIEGDTNINRVKTEFNKGSGFKLGVGWTLLPFLDINLEYRNGMFDEYKQGGMTVKEDTYYKAYMLGVSLPLDLV